MDPAALSTNDGIEWHIDPTGNMRVPGIIFADEALIRDMDEMVLKQVSNVACLPGIVIASYAMPDAHWGYGFPIGGVAAFDPEADGIISMGGVGFDISCGVRTVLTGLSADKIRGVQKALADTLFAQIPAGVGSHGKIALNEAQMDGMLTGGARWAVEEGWGDAADLERIEDGGAVPGADPAAVSARARKRQRREMGTLGSGNHYLEIQEVVAIYDPDTAAAFGIGEGDAVVTIHSGSRGLGHQIGTEYLQRMVHEAPNYGITLPDKELASVPIDSPPGREYLGAMRAGINCALANREILTHLARQAFAEMLPEATMTLLYDVSHNTCKEEVHRVNGTEHRLFVHRKGATRAFGPGHTGLPADLKDVGQPVLIGGSMGTGSHILVGMPGDRAFASACHGAGRQMSRRQAKKRWSGRQIVDDLAARGVLIRSVSQRGVAEEAPGAYKDVDAVVAAAEKAGLTRRVAYLKPLICVKG